jgi:hypothetical protein
MLLFTFVKRLVESAVINVTMIQMECFLIVSRMAKLVIVPGWPIIKRMKVASIAKRVDLLVKFAWKHVIFVMECSEAGCLNNLS